MNRLWVSGWAIPEEWFLCQLREYFPRDTHRVVIPTRNWREQFAQNVAWAEIICGYSFGAFLILKDGTELSASEKSVTLYAPFLDFQSENKMGSKISLTQLKFLKRWLHRSPIEAINDFYHKAGLTLPPAAEIPYSQDDLVWGLDEMMVQRISDLDFPESWDFYCGQLDNLIDIQGLNVYIDTLKPIQAGHCITQILRVLNQLEVK